ncbi:MAG: GNAT family N-acetyltransferase [Deltaproteobacteria bacterium]|nr:GNAT family N-acetyltransferase [Deltaproteobacteria bacterium]
MIGFEIKITRDRGEIQEAQKLRFEVFNLEMKKGLQSSYPRGLDIDEYDPVCEHLIVQDLNKGKIAGTYRLLIGSEARRHFGFYSEREFNLENVKKLKGELLELGRSCSHKDYRNVPLMLTMWGAIADYVKTHQVRYLFGCASLYTMYSREVSEFYSLLKERHYAPEEFRVDPLPEKSFPDLNDKVKTEDPRSLFSRLPSLIKGYLRVGALLCGPPALDLEFGATDLFLLLDVKKMRGEYMRRFGFRESRDHHTGD